MYSISRVSTTQQLLIAHTNETSFLKMPHKHQEAISGCNHLRNDFHNIDRQSPLFIYSVPLYLDVCHFSSKSRARECYLFDCKLMKCFWWWHTLQATVYTTSTSKFKCEKSRRDESVPYTFSYFFEARLLFPHQVNCDPRPGPDAVMINMANTQRPMRGSSKCYGDENKSKPEPKASSRQAAPAASSRCWYEPAFRRSLRVIYLHIAQKMMKAAEAGILGPRARYSPAANRFLYSTASLRIKLTSHLLCNSRRAAI